VNLEISTAAVIYEGVRRHFDVARLRQVLGDSDELRVQRSFHPAYPLFDAGLGEEEQQLLAAIDGSRTVAQLRALELLSPLDTDRLVYALRCAGLVELKGGPKVAEASAEPTERVVPFEPLMPTGRADQEGWVEPVAPAESAEPSQRVEPAGSTGRIESAEPSQRVESAGSMGRIESAEPTDRVEPAGPTGRVESAPAADAVSQSAGPAPQTPAMEGAQAAPENTQPKVSDEDIAAELQGRSGELGLAEAKFQLGEELLKERQFQAAHRLFEEAVKIYDQAAQFHAYLGWSKFQMQPEDPSAAEAALDTLQRAINLNPKVDKSYLFSGYIYKALGRMDQAETQFEKAIQCNPDCTEALHELKSLSHEGG
jgi:tetratricopeptide (TPR) repeat protein